MKTKIELYMNKGDLRKLVDGEALQTRIDDIEIKITFYDEATL